MSYYKTNAVYQLLENTPQHQFRWVSGNAWSLIYGDGKSNPLACILISGKSWAYQKGIFALMKRVSEVSGLPFITITFDDLATDIDQVVVSVNGSIENSISLNALRDIFESFGLPVKNGKASKAINDASSSAYHKWQRENLGSITVSDIDLFRKSSDRTSGEIIELKRSYIQLEKWTPFSADFANFNLLLAISKKCGLELTIAYNLREKNPFRDDASMLSIFKYNKIDTPTFVGTYKFEDFVSGIYLPQI
jgi:hypothetical protein